MYPGGHYLRYLTEEFPHGCFSDSFLEDKNFTPDAYPEISQRLSPDFWEIVAEGYPRNVMRKATEATNNFTWVDASDPNFLHTPLATSGRELVFLPYRDYTKEITYLHYDECTHYGSNPFLWQPIWRNVRLALQRQAKYLNGGVVVDK